MWYEMLVMLALSHKAWHVSAVTHHMHARYSTRLPKTAGGIWHQMKWLQHRQWVTVQSDRKTACLSLNRCCIRHKHSMNRLCWSQYWTWLRSTHLKLGWSKCSSIWKYKCTDVLDVKAWWQQHDKIDPKPKVAKPGKNGKNARPKTKKLLPVQQSLPKYWFCLPNKMHWNSVSCKEC